MGQHSGRSASASWELGTSAGDIFWGLGIICLQPERHASSKAFGASATLRCPAWEGGSVVHEEPKPTSAAAFGPSLRLPPLLQTAPFHLLLRPAHTFLLLQPVNTHTPLRSTSHLLVRSRAVLPTRALFPPPAGTVSSHIISRNSSFKWCENKA